VRLEGIDGSTQVYGIIGDPVGSVRSPEVFNAMFSHENVNAVFIPIHVGPDDLVKAWEGLKSIKNLTGIVITMPHKSRMAELLDELGDTGKFLGSVNTAKRGPDGRWTGDMFDGHGFVDGLRREGHEPEGWKVQLHGLGGAGSAIAFALAQTGVSFISLNDVDQDKCEKLSIRLKTQFPSLKVEIGSAKGTYLNAVINASPLGMREDDPLPFDPLELPSTTLVVDVVTKPEMTPLLSLAEKSGHRVHTGTHMHLGQARLAAKFFGFEKSEKKTEALLSSNKSMQ
jgi:shikimate dehydrogenase